MNDLSRQAKGSNVEILAVSKRQSTEKIRELFDIGHNYFGENYAQELVEKAQRCQDIPIRWSFIGHIQSNKIKALVKYAQEVQSLANLKHARLIQKAALSFEKTPYPIYIACNPENEEGKNGLSLDAVVPFYELLKVECPHLKVMGVMCIPPKRYNDGLEEVPQLYKDLRQLADKVGEGHLSLGMSGDLAIAINGGSNLVRIGSSIFGMRD